MKNRNKFRRSGRVADIAKLDFHDFFGNLFDRTKCKTTEKEKGALMIDKIQNRFNISDFDLDDFRRKLKEKEREDFDGMIREAKERKRIEWDRD